MAATPRTTATGAASAEPSKSAAHAASTRRRHAASASRILAGGISVAATVGITAYLGIEADAAETVALNTVASTSAEPQQRIVVVRRIIREVYAEPTAPVPDASGSGAVPASSVTPAAPAPAPAPAQAAIPTLPSAALAPPPAPAPAPATSSNGS